MVDLLSISEDRDTAGRHTDTDQHQLVILKKSRMGFDDLIQNFKPFGQIKFQNFTDHDWINVGDDPRKML